MNKPDRPTPLAVDPTSIAGKLRQRDVWVCWKLKYKSDREEWTKIPIDATTGDYASATDADTWATFDDAVAYYERDATNVDGVGYVLRDEDMVVGIDLDDCRDPDSGDLEPWAAEVVDEVETYTEASPSGTGLHLLGIGSMPGDSTRGDVEDADGHVEMYENDRFLTVTGATLAESPPEVREANDEIESVYRQYIDAGDEEDAAADGGVAVDTQTNGATPTPDAGETDLSDLSDGEILEIAKNAENGDYFTDLWEGRWQRHTPRWQESSHSEARQAFAYMLAFYTGGDEQRMLSIFKGSDLCRGDDDLRTFENYEAPKAAAAVSEHYDPNAGGDPTPPTPNDPVGIDDDASAVGLLTPANVKAVAGLGEDGTIDDLNDREKAACVWDLLFESDEFHVCVRRDNGSLWAFDGSVWNPDGERALRHAARRALGSMNYGENVLTELKAQARSDPSVEVDADTFGVETGRVAVANGLLDMHAAADDAGDDAIRDLTPEDYALEQLPVRYDPDAESDRWRQFVGEVVEPAKIDAVQEYVGYTLHRGAMPHAKALLLVGSGKNGKTTFLNVVRELLGSEQTTSKPVHKFDDENHVADLYGTVANIDADLSEGSLSSRGIATFKRVIGGDAVDAAVKYQDPFSFQPTAKHLYACNQVPDVSKYVGDHDIAFWRRWIVVEFPNYFTEEERDPALELKLTDEDTLPAVLNWAIDGWARLRENGQFTNVEGHDETRRRWQSWGESVEQFIADHVERDEDAPRLTTGDAYERYQAWCRKIGADTVGRKRFTNTLKNEDVGYGRHRINGRSARGYDALGLSDEVPDPDDTDDEDDDGGSGTKQQGLT